MALVQVLSLSLLLLALPAVFASPPVSVIIFGAQPNVDTNEVALKNSAALRNALEHVQVGKWRRREGKGEGGREWEKEERASTFLHSSLPPFPFYLHLLLLFAHCAEHTLTLMLVVSSLPFSGGFIRRSRRRGL